MNNFYKEVKKLLVDEGCSFKCQGKGDHEIWYSPITRKNISVDSKIKSRHTANAILKAAGINKKF